MGPHFFGIVAQPLVLRLVVVAVVVMMAAAAAAAAAAMDVVVSVRWFRSPPRARRSLPAAWR